MQKKSIFKMKGINVGSSSARTAGDKSESANTEDVKPQQIFFDLSYKFYEGEGVLKPALYQKITGDQPQPDPWHKPMNFMYLYNLNYSYRAKTEAIFKDRENYYFDFFFVDTSTERSKTKV